MNLTEYASYDGVDLADLTRRGEVTAPELARLARQAIEQLNPILNFMAYTIPDDEVVYCDSKQQGAFQGVPFLIKEGSAVVGQPWNMASRLGVGQIAEADETLITRFRQTGVTLLGQSTAPEAGNAPTTESVLRGPTRNPWNTNTMPGGSSGGAAAAVAAGVMPVAHASDGGGSIRIPAACCGLVGLKPTRARTPCDHSSIFCLATQHIVSRTVRDCAVMLDAIQGPEIGGLYYVSPPARFYFEEISIAPRSLKIGFSTQSPSGEPVHADCIQGVEKAVTMCKSLGHQVEERALPYEWDRLCPAFLDLWSYSHPYKVALMEQATSQQVGPDTREVCNLAGDVAACQAIEYVRFCAPSE